MKRTFRNNILEAIHSLSREEKRQKSQLIQQQLAQLLAKETGNWGAYCNLQDEPEIKWNEVSETIQWCFPETKNDTLQFTAPTNEGFAKSPQGFLQPVNGLKINLNQMNGFVIPALAYGTDGERLGRGAGLYDRTLKNHPGRKVGVCFAISYREDVPHEQHDIKCDAVITENKIYKVKQSEGESTWN